MKRQSLPVDFENDPIQQEVGHLADAGLFTRAIARETGMSEGQVTYRLGILRVRRAKYRDGTSPMAKIVVAAIHARTRMKDQMEVARKMHTHLGTMTNRFVRIGHQYKTRKLHQNGSNSKEK